SSRSLCIHKMNLSCRFLDEESILCNGTQYNKPEKQLSIHDEWFWIYLGIYTALVLFAGLMSGLTMGLLSLDPTNIRVLMGSGTPQERKYAARILPLVQRHHLLLVTLLLANAAAVESMPLFLDKISNPVTAIVVSVSAVLLFGEVFPQALCTRYGLAIGANLSPLVYLLMGLTFIISYPIAKLLDCLLGKNHATFFRRAELKVLVDIHGPSQRDEGDGSEGHGQEALSIDEVLIIKGALDMKYKTVKDAMVPLESVFMLSDQDVMDFETMTKILLSSHSRIPVYSNDHSNIQGILLVKTLIKLDPDDRTAVKELMNHPKAFRKVPFVLHTTPLFDVLNDFQTGKSHLAIVQERGQQPDPNHPDESHRGKVVGIITLEDVMEELIQEEIIDETDVFVDVHKRIQVARAKASNICRSTSITDKYPRLNRSQSETSATAGEVRQRPPSSNERLVDVDVPDNTPLLVNL
ncbi:unnamed protein product, partial [Owenia fusiformis]